VRAPVMFMGTQLTSAVQSTEAKTLPKTP